MVRPKESSTSIRSSTPSKPISTSILHGGRLNGNLAHEGRPPRPALAGPRALGLARPNASAPPQAGGLAGWRAARGRAGDFGRIVGQASRFTGRPKNESSRTSNLPAVTDQTFDAQVRKVPAAIVDFWGHG